MTPARITLLISDKESTANERVAVSRGCSGRWSGLSEASLFSVEGLGIEPSALLCSGGLSKVTYTFFFPQAFMFWVVDNFLMRKGKTKAKLEERGANQDSRNGSKVRYRRAASHEESESEVGASLTLSKSLAIIPWALGDSALKFVPEC